VVLRRLSVGNPSKQTRSPQARSPQSSPDDQWGVGDPGPAPKAEKTAKNSTQSTFSLHPRLTPIVVILPIYNEQSCIQATFHQVQRFLYSHPHFTFIFVDDGSTDLTKTILSNSIRSAKNPQIQLLAYGPQAGKGYAIKTGIQAAQQSEFVCLIDGNLAYSLDHLESMMEALQSADVVIGSRRLFGQPPQGLSFQRKLAGTIAHWLSRQLLNLNYPDMQAGLQGFRQDAAQALFDRQKLEGFSFDIELIYLAKKYGYSIREIPAQISAHHQRKISTVNLVKDAIGLCRDLMRIRFNDWLGRYR
jgi:dolichyl-phosphate beta-glucosyltransferase